MFFENFAGLKFNKIFLSFLLRTLNRNQFLGYLENILEEIFLKIFDFTCLSTFVFKQVYELII